MVLLTGGINGSGIEFNCQAVWADTTARAELVALSISSAWD
jgi:hypothetical protein